MAGSPQSIASTSTASTEASTDKTGDTLALHETADNSNAMRKAYESSKRAYPFYGEQNMKRAFRPTYNIDLKDFLEKTVQGKSILNYYTRNKQLCRKIRNLLVEILIKEAINNSNT